MKSFVLLFVVFILNLNLQAQLEQGVAEKISPSIASLRNTVNKDLQYHFFVIVTDSLNFKRLLVEKNLLHNIVSEYMPSNLYIMRLSWKTLDSFIIPSSIVKFVDIVRKPTEETVIDGFDLSTNKINLVHDRFKTINGEGTIVSVKENKPDSTDIDFRGRFLSSPLASSNVTSHATIMSTIVAGAGNSHYTGKGVAWSATLTASDFTSLLPDADADYSTNKISIQNHSYGTGIENYYGADALAYDASTGTNPSLLHVFSAGNSGDKVSTTGPFAGIQRYSNLTGSFKMAKNILVVGSIDSFYNIASLSSRGPAYDGRLSPHLVAFGLDGTSGAAAIVSGTALLLQQAYKELNDEQLPSSALIRSILLNTTDDTGPIGIDFQSGYGNLNAHNALSALIGKWYRSGTITDGETVLFRIDVPENVHRLKVTICWNDVPGSPNEPKSLVNDIDMRLIHDVSGTSWQPWVLNSYPHADSLAQLPSRKKDSINNTEQITIDQPAEGSYTIAITGYKIPSGLQPYSVSYYWDTLNHFQWQYPTSSDILESGDKHTLRWASTFNVTNGQLDYSKDSGRHWEMITGNVDLSRKYFAWNSAIAHGAVIFRMLINHQSFISDTSLIASQLSTGVGFNCVDSFLIYWNKHLHASAYTVYQLGNRYLEPFKVVTDTSVVLKKSINKVLHYAVAPNIQWRTGIRSYTFDYTSQGIDCYVKRFTVDLLNSSVGSIQFELGTRYEVQDVILEKWQRSGFVPIHAISDSVLQFNFTDNKLISGGNRYRVRISLKNGNNVFSNIETIYYLTGKNYLVYPNPASTNFVIVSNDADSSELILYNTIGQQVLRKRLSSEVQKISVRQLKRGLYFLVVRQKNKNVHQGSVIIH
jgi:hypothetical protein